MQRAKESGLAPVGRSGSTAPSALGAQRRAVVWIDPVAVLGAVALCTIAALAACYVPVSRAMRMAASDALRAE